MSKQIKISEVLSLLEDGLTRPEIAETLDISMADCRRLFQNEKLKGKKPKKQMDFELIDDTVENMEVDFSEVGETVEDVREELEEISNSSNDEAVDEDTIENVTAEPVKKMWAN
jgi:orotate phosphoribosyltransferase-like protein